MLAGTTSTTAAATAAMTRVRYYAVACGRARGLYSTWQQCEQQVKGWPGAMYKSFATLQDARAYLHSHPDTTTSSSRCATTTTAAAVAARADTNVTVQQDGQRVPPLQPSPTRKRLRGASDVLRDHHDNNDNNNNNNDVADNVQVVYVDGACRSNGKGLDVARAGYGGFYGSNHDARNFALPVPRHEAQTNNRAELYAVLHAVQQGFADAGVCPSRCRRRRRSDNAQNDDNANDVDETAVPCEADLTSPLRPLRIYTDSRYVVTGLREYSVRWRRNGFRLANNTPVLNQDLWRRLLAWYDAYNRLYAAQQQQQQQQQQQNDRTASLTATATTHARVGVDVQHVRGHANIPGNVAADMLAVRGALSVD